MKKETLDAIKKIGKQFGIREVNDNKQGESGFYCLEMVMNANTWMDYDLVIEVMYHPCDIELGEISANLHEEWRDFDADEEAKRYIIDYPMTDYTARQIVEEFEKLDELWEKFSDALEAYREKNLKSATKTSL